MSFNVQTKLLVIISVDFHPTNELMIIYSAFVKLLSKKLEENEAVLRIFVVFGKLMIQLGGRSYIIFLLNLVSQRRRYTNIYVSE